MLQRIRDGFGTWVIVIVLGLIAVSFIFWGVDFSVTGPNYAAKVNGEEIPLEEFERNLQAEQSQFQELYRIELNEDVRRQLRASVMDRLVSQRALSQRVDELGYRVSDERLTESIRAIPTFQIGGEFSMDAYEGQLAFQGMSPAGFEALQREQLELLDLQTGLVNSTFVTPAQYQRYVQLMNQRRAVAYASFEVESFLDKVEVTDEEVAAHYDEFSDRYMTEETAEIEYVELSRAAIAEQVEVTDEELRGYYEQRRDEFRSEEERSASHILITAGEGESDEDAAARAEALVERIRAGEDFDALAAEYSDDPGTASSGGDLGWIGRGMLAGPFEDTLYAMQEIGAVSDPVRTDFGWHIIRFDELRAGEERTFEEVREELASQYRTERADDLFYDQANRLADVAFEEYDNLERVASATGLPLETMERFPRTGAPEVFPNSAPVVDAVFGIDALETGLNSDLLELSEEHVAVVRVVERFPPEQRPLEEVSDEIRQSLIRDRAEALAAESASAFAAALPETLTPEFLGGPAPADSGAGAADDATDDGGSADAAGSADGESSAADGSSADASAEGASAEGASDAGAADDAEAAAEGETPTEGTAEESSSDPEATGGDSPAAQLAAEHGGTWHAPQWVRRTDTGVPSEILATAFNLGVPAEGTRLREPVQLANGNRALLVLSGVEPGDVAEVPLDQRTALREQLLQANANAELGAYATSIRNQADVNVSPDVLDPQF